MLLRMLSGLPGFLPASIASPTRWTASLKASPTSARADLGSWERDPGHRKRTAAPGFHRSWLNLLANSSPIDQTGNRSVAAARVSPPGKQRGKRSCRPAFLQKIFRFRRRANHLYKFAPSRSSEGRCERHGRGAGCGGRGGALDGRCGMRTAKSCGPDAPTLASSSRRYSREMTVARKPGH